MKDIGAFPTQYLYGTVLRLPEEFFTDADHPEDHNYYLQLFKNHMQLLRPIPASHHSTRGTFIHVHSLALLNKCLIQKLREETYVTASPYSVLHKVLQRIDNKVFKIDING